MDPTLASYTDEYGNRQPTRAIDRPRLCAATAGHVVEKPRVWPPRLRSQGRSGKEYAAVNCTRCGAVVIVYNPLQEGIRFADDPTPPEAA